MATKVSAHGPGSVHGHVQGINVKGWEGARVRGEAARAGGHKGKRGRTVGEHEGARVRVHEN